MNWLEIRCKTRLFPRRVPARGNTFQRRRFASPTKPIQAGHPERSEGSLAGQRSFAALRMTKRDGLFFEMYCAQGVPCGGFTSTGENHVQEAEIIKDLAAFLEQLVANDQFSGAVLVAKNGSPLFKQAYGSASKGFNVSNRIDTKFNLASMNKMFTPGINSRLHMYLDFGYTNIL